VRACRGDLTMATGPARKPENDHSSGNEASTETESEEAAMKAHVGDRLVVDGDGDRVGLIIGVQHKDGTPPYVIKWQSDGHVALVFPGPYARIVPAEHAVGK
jgi:hypothetical protein